MHGVGVLPLHPRLTLSTNSFIIAAPSRPILTACPVYGSSGRLLEIESQANAGVGYGGQGKGVSSRCSLRCYVLVA